jgi:hypothetical protein
MALPTPTKPWIISPLRGRSWEARITLTGASQVSDYLTAYDLPIDTIHIFGTFNATNISVLGFNADPILDVSVSTPQVLHRADAPASTFSAVATELMAGVIEVPRYIVAQSNGAVTSVTIVCMFADRRGV